MDRQIIRELAAQYYDMAQGEENIERRKLHKCVNDLQMIRPVVQIYEIPWHEMNIGGELNLYCEDEKLREIEYYFRTEILLHKYFTCDNYMRPYYPVYKAGRFGRMGGLEIDETLIHNRAGGEIHSHEYHDILQTEDDLEKLCYIPSAYDHKATMEQFEFIGDLLGDIMPIKITGYQAPGYALWDVVAQYKGVENLLSDLIDRPEFMHKIARKYTDGFIRAIEDNVKHNLYSQETSNLPCSPPTSDLIPVADPDCVKPENVWGIGAAQIFGSVSPAMHDEFETPYLIEAVKAFGLVYYGCCERLDNKIHLLKKLHNLRKISISPWTNVDIAGEQIGKEYVMSIKPNPAHVGPGFDEDVIRKEIGDILASTRKNNCIFDIVLKDISTVSNKPQNLVRWAEIAMSTFMEY